MWFSRVPLIGLVFVALACGGSAKPSTLSSSWVPPEILAQVPADSPYVFATLQPIAEKLRQRMMGTFNQRVSELLKAAALITPAERPTLPPYMRAALVLADELRGKQPDSWWRELGLDPNGRFVLYGLSVWPVARVELTDPARVRGLIERVAAAADLAPQRGTLSGRAYWSLGTAEITVVAAVLEREAVVAVLPTSALATALPLVLGTQAPARPLGTTTTVTDLLARHRFTNLMLGYIDLRSALAVLTGPSPSPMDAPLRALTGPIPPACHSDLDRLVSVMPRIAFGYRKFDDDGFAGAAVFETSPGVASALQRLRTSVPEVAAPVAGNPLFAIGAAVNPEATVAWLRSVADNVRARPFTCPWLRPINEASGELAQKLASPLPPFLRGVRGFSLVVDRLTIEPFDIDGHLLISSDRTADLVATMTGAIPGFPSLAVKPDGRPVALPMQQLQLPIRSAHIAMTPDRIVIAAGASSGQRAAAHLASPAPRTSPLGLMAFDAARLQALLAAIGEKATASIDYLGKVGMTFDATDAGLGFEFWGSWQAPTPAIAQ